MTCIWHVQYWGELQAPDLLIKGPPRPLIAPHEAQAQHRLRGILSVNRTTIGNEFRSLSSHKVQSSLVNLGCRHRFTQSTESHLVGALEEGTAVVLLSARVQHQALLHQAPYVQSYRTLKFKASHGAQATNPKQQIAILALAVRIWWGVACLAILPNTKAIA